MERSFSRFKGPEREEFIKDLAFLTGCETDDIQEITVSKGCVRFEAKLSEALVQRLAVLFEKLAHEDRLDPELQAFKKFVSKHKIANIGADYTVNLQIVSKKSQDRHVVFVHGWLGNPDSFGKLPDLLRDSFHCGVSIYQYPSKFWKDSPSLVFVSRNLDNWVRNHAMAQRLAFVSHSYGGLVVRKLMTIQRNYPDPLDNRTKQLIFLASPHNGAALASLAGRVPGIQKEQVRELSTDSPVLFELNEEWQQWASRMVPHACQVRSIVGYQDSVVSLTSAQGLDPQATVILDRDHTNIARVMTEQDEVFATVRRLLENAAFDEPGVIRESTAVPDRPKHEIGALAYGFPEVQCPGCGVTTYVAASINRFACPHCQRVFMREPEGWVASSIPS